MRKQNRFSRRCSCSDQEKHQKKMEFTFLRNGFGGAPPSKYVTRSVTTFAQPSQESKITRKASNTKLPLMIAEIAKSVNFLTHWVGCGMITPVRTTPRASGGTGRRTGFRYQRSQGHEGSSPSSPTIELSSTIQKTSLHSGVFCKGT